MNTSNPAPSGAEAEKAPAPLAPEPTQSGPSYTVSRPDGGYITVFAEPQDRRRRGRDTYGAMWCDWMGPHGLDLEPCEIFVLSIIYRHSQGSMGMYTGTVAEIRECIPFKDRTVRAALRSLEARGLISSVVTETTFANGKHLRGQNYYRVEQEAIDRALQVSLKWKQAHPEVEVKYPKTAGRFAWQNLPSEFSTSGNQEKSFQQSAGHFDRQNLPSEAETCEHVSETGKICQANDRGSLQNLPTEYSCGNAEANMRSKQATTCGPVKETAGFVSDRKQYKEEEEEEDELNLRDEEEIQPSPFPKDDSGIGRGASQSELSCLNRMLALSSKGTLVRRNAWDATLSAFLAAVHDPRNDLTPERVVECFRAYLSWFYGPERKDEEKQQRYELFPKNFIERPAGLLHWDAKLKAGYVPPAPEPSAPEPKAPSPEETVELKRMPDGSWWYGKKGCGFGDLMSLGRVSKDMSRPEALEAAVKAMGWYEDAQAHQRAAERATAPQRPKEAAPRLPSLMELSPIEPAAGGEVA